MGRSQNRMVWCGPFCGDGCHLSQFSLHADSRGSLADAVRLPFHDGEFDKVLCTGVLMHIVDSDLAVRELVRVLRPGGGLVCSINNSLSPYSFPVRLWNLTQEGICSKISCPCVLS